MKKNEGKIEKSKKKSSRKGVAEKKVAVCEKAPEFVEHYRWEDEDPPCDDGRTGDN